MTKTIILKQAQPDDVVRILKLINKTFKDDHPELPEVLDYNGLMWITDIICKGYSCNATINGRLIGSIGASFTTYPWNRMRNRMELEWVIAHPVYAKLGVVQQMIKKCREVADKNRADFSLTVKGKMVVSEKFTWSIHAVNE